MARDRTTGPQINGAEGGYRVGPYREFAVPPALRGMAEVGWSCRARAGRCGERAERPERVLPETGVSLTFVCRRGHRGQVDDPALVVMGPIATVRLFRPAQGDEMVGIRLRPEWCGDLLGVHPREVVDAMSRDALGLWAGLALDRLARTRDSAGAAFALMTVLESRWLGVRPGPGVRLAHQALERQRAGTRGADRVQAVADEIGVSCRHLRRVVDDACGFGMKWFQRVRRLHRAVSAASLSREPSWSRLAIASGYYDQAHMIREFRELAGVTPVALRLERRPGRASGLHDPPSPTRRKKPPVA